MQKTLRASLTQGALSAPQFKTLQGELEEKYPDDIDVVNTVISAVEKTEFQEPMSAISLSTHNDKDWISIVNSDGNHLKFPSYKLLGLLENPETARLLHRFPKNNWKDSSDPFVFKNYQDGEVSACFDPAHCRIDVAHVLSSGNRANDRCEFYLEKEYLTCLFIVLARLRNDREHINQLLENAEGTLTFDPFEAINQIN
jgi:hypothetical protein